MKMLFKGHSTRLELLIEKIHSNKETLSCQDSEHSGTGNTDMESISSGSIIESPKSHSSETDIEIERNNFSIPNGLLDSSIEITENEDVKHTSRDSLEHGMSDETKHYEGLLQFNCKYCPRMFKHKRSRDRHVKLHTGDKKYKCLQCHSAFARSDHLKIHMKTHDIRKHFKCKSCNKGYNTASALAFHQRIHSNEIEEKSEESSPHSSPTVNLNCCYCTEISSETTKNHLFLTKNSPKPSPVKAPLSDLETDSRTFCVYCFQEFSNTKDMFNHVKSVHRNDIHTTVQTNHSINDGPSDILNVKLDLLKNYKNACYQKSLATKNFGEYPQRNYNISMTVQNISFENNYLTTHDILSHKKKEIHVEKKNANATVNIIDEPFICSCCYAQLPNFKSFLMHMENHVSSSKTEFNEVCVFCGEETSDSSTLSNHIFRHSVKQLKNYCCCCSCDKSFSEHEKLQKHLIDEHVLCVFKCSLCSEIFDDKLSMKMHLSSKHTYDSEHFECNLCSNKVFHSKTSAELHVSKSHFDQLGFTQITQQNENFHCVFCDKVFSDDFNRYVHVLREHSNNEHLLTQTKLSVDLSSQREDSKSHEFEAADEYLLNTSQKTGGTALQCAYCREYCKTKADLQYHLKTHQNSTKLKFKCNICDELYPSSNKLANHKLVHCKIVDGNICLQCKSIIKDRDAFYKHQLKHNTIKSNVKSSLVLPSICIVCSQTLQSDMEIELHAKFHLKFITRAHKKTQICLNCSTEFSLSKNESSLCGKCLNTDERDDFEIKNRELAHSKLHCYLCKNYFNTNEKLQVHLIEHNFFGINQYSCYVCSSVFTAASGLQSHLLEHNLKEKPYQCSKCQMSFFFRAELDNHRYLHSFQMHYEQEQFSSTRSKGYESATSQISEEIVKKEPDK